MFTISEDPATLKNLGVFWEGQVAGVAGGTIQVYLWNANTSSYTSVGSTISDTDVTLSLVDTADPAQYVDASNGVTILVVNTGDTAGIQTDYVKITLRQCSADSDCDGENPCTGDACSAEGACSYSNNTAACSDGNPCTVGDVCSGGECRSGAAPDCSAFGDQCHMASCDPAGAEGNCSTLSPVADGTACVDELFCTVNEVCTAGVCSGSPRDCSGSGDECNTGVCNEETDACEAQPVADGTACVDELFCTVNEACTTGVCGGSPQDCGG